jgi:plasmid stabilization system protein ParE
MVGYEFTDRAARDFEAARSWYDQRSNKLGRRFVDDVVSSIETIRERPESFPVVRRGVRATRCRKFPYRIYFDVLGDRVALLAIYHTSRRPDRWDDPDRE